MSSQLTIFFVIVQNGIYGLILFLKFVILKFLQYIYIFFYFLKFLAELKCLCNNRNRGCQFQHNRNRGFQKYHNRSKNRNRDFLKTHNRSITDWNIYLMYALIYIYIYSYINTSQYLASVIFTLWITYFDEENNSTIFYVMVSYIYFFIGIWQMSSGQLPP